MNCLYEGIILERKEEKEKDEVHYLLSILIVSCLLEMCQKEITQEHATLNFLLWKPPKKNSTAIFSTYFL